jgi:transposase
MRDPDNQRLLDELGWHDERGNLTRFLSDPSVPPTDNLSERELRLPIQARKVSQCVKNDRGAHALEVHTSVIRTAQRRQPTSLLDALRLLYFGPQPQAPPQPVP